MSRWRRLFRLPILGALALLLVGLTWPSDDAGVPAPPCTYIDDSITPNLLIFCSKSNPLPSAPGVTAATDPFGFGRQWFFQAGAPFTPAQTRFALFVDQTTVLSFRGPGGTNLAIDTSPDGGKTFPVGITVGLPANSFFNGPIAIFGGIWRFIGSDNLAHPRFATSPNLSTWTFSADLTGDTSTFQAFGNQANTVILWGQNTLNVALFCRSANNGSTFSACVTIAGSNGPQVGDRYTVASPAAGIWLLVDAIGQLYRSTNDGVSFALQTTLPTGSGTGGTAVLCLSATNCVATNAGRMSISTDAGVTWTGRTSFAFNVRTLCAFSTSILAGFNDSLAPSATGAYVGAVVSNDGGLTWSAVTVNGGFTGGTVRLNSMSCVSSGKAFVQGGVSGVNYGGWYNPTVAGGGLVIGRTGNALLIDANGNLFANQGLQSASGSAGSWPFAPVQGQTLLNAAPTVSAAGAGVSITLTGATGQRVCVRSITIYDGVVGTNAITMTVQDAGTVKLDLGNILPAGATVGAAVTVSGTPLFCGSTGNNVVINVGAGAATQVTHTSVVADLQ